MALLTEAEIANRLVTLPGWAHDGNSIRNTYGFPNFVHAMAFVNQVADVAEELNHHPDIDIRYNRVSFVISTHSAGGLTEKDFDLAEQIQKLS